MLTFFKDKWDYVLIPDCRFPNEVNYLREVGFNTIHIRIIRDGFISPLTEQQQNHPSETALDNVQADTYFHNNGTLSDLREKVVRWVTEHNGHHQITFEEIIN